MLKNLLIGSALVGGALVGYNIYKKQRERKKVDGVLQAVGAPVALTTKGAKRPGATKIKKFATVRPGAKKVAKFSPLMKSKTTSIIPTRSTRIISPTTSIQPRTQSTQLLRPATLSECCTDLCLPTLERVNRKSVPVKNRISRRRNLIQDYYTC